MSLKLAIWDLDGTIVDSRKIIQTAMEIAFDSVGKPLPEFEQTRHTIGLPLAQAIQTLAPDETHERIQIMTQNYSQAFVTMRNDPNVPEPLYEGALDLLKHLAEQGWLMGVATGKSRRGVSTFFEKHDLAQFFDAHYCSDDGPGKPHPHMIERNLDQLGCFAEDAVMIGDATFDMIMARSANVRALGVSWGFGQPHEIEEAGAHEVHHDFESLQAALNAFKNQRSVE